MSRRRRTSRERPVVNTDHHRRLESPYEPLRVISDDEVAHIHNSAIRYLAEEGLSVTFDEARDILSQAGAAEGDETMMRFDPEAIAMAIEAAPGVVELNAPNPDRSFAIGGRSVALLPVAGPPFAWPR